MKRRVVALLMATMMGAFCITGCGSSKEATSDKAAKTEKEADTESKTRLILHPLFILSLKTSHLYRW